MDRKNPSTIHLQATLITRSARVSRYHTEDTLHKQSVGEHTYGVMWLLVLMGVSSKNLLEAALMHDAGEHVSGDVPAPVKRLDLIRQAINAVEDSTLAKADILCPELTVHEHHLLKMADKLEGALFCLSEAKRGNRDIKWVLDNYISYTEALQPTGYALDMLNYIIGERNELFG